MKLVLKPGIFIAIIFFAMISCENKRTEIMALSKPKLSPSQHGKDITMLYTDSAKLKMTIKAKSMMIFDKNVKEPFTLMPQGVLIAFYNQQEKQEATLKGNYALYYTASKRMEVKYDVEVINKNGEKLNTEHLIWDETNKKITSNAFVKINTGKEIIMGKGLESNEDFTQYQIKEVTGTIQINDEEL